MARWRQTVMQELSPFSLLNRYKVSTINDYIVEPRLPTPREIMLLNILKSCGTAAGFQLENLWTNKEGRRKLKKLAGQKIIARHKLDGKHKLNVYSLNPVFELETALRQMAFAQLYMKIRSVMPCAAALGPAPFTGMINLHGKPYPVLVIRKGDAISTLASKVASAPRLIIIAEEYIKLDPGVDYRITTDRDLLEKPLHYAFRLPDGSQEKVLQFAAS